MKCNRTWHLPLLGMLAALVLIGWASFDAASSADAAPATPAAASATADIAAPDFSLSTLDGEPFRLSAQRGKVVVLNFWATWCPPCRKEIPDFIALQQAFGDEIVVVGVSLDELTVRPVKAFADEMGINYPVMLDDGTASEAYGPIATLPTTFLIDRDGMVRGYAPGMVTRETIETAIADLVAKPASR